MNNARAAGVHVGSTPEDNMQKLNTHRILLSVALLGTFATAPLLTPTAQAKPPKYAPAYGYRNKDKKDKKDKRRDDRRDERRDDRREDRRDDRDRYDRDRYDNDRDYRDRYNRDQRNNRNNATYAGTVTNVRSGNSFDLRANGRTYNVYTASSLPRGLNRGDEVRVYGRPYGDNDIRNASVRITDNNRNDDPRRDDRNNNNYGSARNYSGTVLSVKNSREFDVRIDGRTYNVYATSSTSGLSRGDEVRIYGQRYGDNDLRNANVRITRNR